MSDNIYAPPTAALTETVKTSPEFYVISKNTVAANRIDSCARRGDVVHDADGAVGDLSPLGCLQVFAGQKCGSGLAREDGMSADREID